MLIEFEETVSFFCTAANLYWVFQSSNEWRGENEHQNFDCFYKINTRFKPCFEMNEKFSSYALTY